jgi:hypothetical protein
MVVKPTMIVVAAESHDREEKRENSLQKKKNLGGEGWFFFNFWTGWFFFNFWIGFSLLKP